MGALEAMRDNGMFSQLVFYLEACESGSMFDGQLSQKSGVFATTASTPDQSSYAFYYNDTLSTYMADEYSIRWMQDSTENWDAYESLLKQFQDVAAIVKESQPQKYGDERFENEAIEDFEAFEDHESKMTALKKSSTARSSEDKAWAYTKEWVPSSKSVSSRDVKLAVLQFQFLSAKGDEAMTDAAILVMEEVGHREDVDLVFDELIKFVTGYNGNEGLLGRDDMVDAIKYGHIRPTNFECLKEVYAAFEMDCEPFDDYSLKYVSSLANMCELYGDSAHIKSAMECICLRCLFKS